MTKTEQIKNFLAENYDQTFTAEEIGNALNLGHPWMLMNKLYKQQREVEEYGERKNSRNQTVRCYRALRKPMRGALGITRHTIDRGIERIKVEA